MKHTIILILFVFTFPVIMFAQDTLPSCIERPTQRETPWYDITRWCLETVIDDGEAAARIGRMAYTALAVAPDGTLYAARPLHGEIYAITDTNGDLLPDTPALFASGLTLPNGLTYYEDALYVSGGAHIYRIMLDGEVETLVDDLPTGAGFWTGSVIVGADQRLYVVTGAPCDQCTPDDPLRGAVLSFALDGTDRQVVATGLRASYDLAFAAGALWTTDTAPDQATGETLDELNRVEEGAFFGFPDCWGDCAEAASPALRLPTHSSPLGMAAYDGSAFPDLRGALLIAFSGAYNSVDLRNIGLMAVRFDAAGQPTNYDLLVPQQAGQTEAYGGRVVPRPIMTADNIELGGFGFSPHRPIDVTVDARGWIYISTGGGRILALRDP